MEATIFHCSSIKSIRRHCTLSLKVQDRIYEMASKEHNEYKPIVMIVQEGRVREIKNIPRDTTVLAGCLRGMTRF